MTSLREAQEAYVKALTARKLELEMELAQINAALAATPVVTTVAFVRRRASTMSEKSLQRQAQRDAVRKGIVAVMQTAQDPIAFDQLASRAAKLLPGVRKPLICAQITWLRTKGILKFTGRTGGARYLPIKETSK